MPRLSVLLSVRDGQQTIGSAVRSTLRTLPRDAELVVLDDGSTDRTAEVLDAIKHPSLRVIHGQGSGGLGLALNHLLDVTDSEWVGRMDDDDYALPGRFTRTCRALTRGVDFAFTTTITFGRSRPPRPSMPIPIRATSFPYQLLLTNPVRHDTLTARRQSLVDLGGYRQVPSEDYDLWVRAATQGMRLARLGIYGLGYREHAGQLTSTTGWRSRSHHDPLLSEAYADLSQTLLGQSFPRLVTLAAQPEATARPLLEKFDSAFRSAVDGLGAFDRAQLIAKLNKRRSQLSQGWRTATTGGSP